MKGTSPLNTDEIRKLLKKRRKPMEIVSENLNKYGEEMKGKFSHNPRGNGIVISVTNPFVQEIHIDCDEDVYGKYNNTYSLLAPQADHPEGYGRQMYCPPKFGPLPKPRLWYNIHDLKGGPDGETKTKKLHP